MSQRRRHRYDPLRGFAENRILIRAASMNAKIVRHGMHWTIDRVKITKIVELETVGHTRFILPLAGPDQIRALPWLIPHFATAEGRLKMSIHSLVVETPT